MFFLVKPSPAAVKIRTSLAPDAMALTVRNWQELKFGAGGLPLESFHIGYQDRCVDIGELMKNVGEQFATSRHLWSEGKSSQGVQEKKRSWSKRIVPALLGHARVPAGPIWGKQKTLLRRIEVQHPQACGPIPGVVRWIEPLFHSEGHHGGQPEE